MGTRYGVGRARGSGPPHLNRSSQNTGAGAGRSCQGGCHEPPSAGVQSLNTAISHRLLAVRRACVQTVNTPRLYA
jgi:hypothetical protein